MPTDAVSLNQQDVPDDTSCMIEFELEELNANMEWRLVLAAYQTQHLAVNGQNPKFDGWLTRLQEVEGVEEPHLSRIHGQLIALSFLEFQLRGRTFGMLYRLSVSGKQALSQRVVTSAAVASEIADSEHMLPTR